MVQQSVQMQTALIVVREARDRFLIRHALRKLGFEVLAARSRSEALDAISRQSPDLLLLDQEPGAYRLTRLADAQEAGGARIDLGAAPGLERVVAGVSEGLAGLARAADEGGQPRRAVAAPFDLPC